MKRTPRDTEASSRSFTRRTLLMTAAMGTMMTALGVRMHTLGVRQAGEFELLAEENRVNIQLLPPARGLILDRNTKVLAGNEQVQEGSGRVTLMECFRQ